MHNRAVLSLMLAVVVTGACSKKAPAPVPIPTPSEPGAAPPSVPTSRPDDGAGDRNHGADAGRTALGQRIHFEYDQASLTAEAKRILDAKAAALRAIPGVRLRIEGHADERGSDEYNLVLSNQRANEAKRYLVSLGIDATRLVTSGLGEEQPLDARSAESAWALNRRAEFRIDESLTGDR